MGADGSKSRSENRSAIQKAAFAASIARTPSGKERPRRKPAMVRRLPLQEEIKLAASVSPLSKPDSADANHAHFRAIKFQPHRIQLRQLKSLCPICRRKIRQRDPHRLKHRLPIFFVSFFVQDRQFCEL